MSQLLMEILSSSEHPSHKDWIPVSDTLCRTSREGEGKRGREGGERERERGGKEGEGKRGRGGEGERDRSHFGNISIAYFTALDVKG